MIIAITGGIGSGKSYICSLLAKYGVEVYDCDAHAKRLMATSTALQHDLNNLVGQPVFADGTFNKALLAQYLLESDAHKRAVNNIVHPAVAHDFETSGYTWLESAILFESEFDKRTKIDKVICVTAPVEVRVQRIMKRDHITEEKAREWIAKQMPQEEIMARSNFNIVCDGSEKEKEEQVRQVLSALK